MYLVLLIEVVRSSSTEMIVRVERRGGSRGRFQSFSLRRNRWREEQESEAATGTKEEGEHGRMDYLTHNYPQQLQQRKVRTKDMGRRSLKSAVEERKKNETERAMTMHDDTRVKMDGEKGDNSIMAPRVQSKMAVREAKGISCRLIQSCSIEEVDSRDPRAIELPGCHAHTFADRSIRVHGK